MSFFLNNYDDFKFNVTLILITQNNFSIEDIWYNVRNNQKKMCRFYERSMNID